MKKLMIIGGLMGFLIGIVFGLAYGSAWPFIIWRASVATLGAGLLMRWWGGVWVRSLQESYSERLGSDSVHTRPVLGQPKK